LFLTDLLNLAPAFPFLTVIAGSAGAYLIRRQDRRDKAEDARLAAADKAEARREANDRAAEISRLVSERARELADMQLAQIEIKRLQDQVSHRETITKLEATHRQAEAAYKEANDVNVKIARVAEATQAVLEQNQATGGVAGLEKRQADIEQKMHDVQVTMGVEMQRPTPPPPSPNVGITFDPKPKGK
jgi:prophage DNA circulation protein